MYAVLGLAAALMAWAAEPASAQFKPRPMGAPSVGETYHIEGGLTYWTPTSDILIASTELGIPGTQIDFKSDLGLTDRNFPGIRLQLRPGRKHKLRFQYVPIKYEQSAVLRDDIVFNGQRYTLGLPVNSSLIWNTFRVGYEYDFIILDKVFAGFILEAKYTDVTARLQLPIRQLNENTHIYGPIPAVGGIVRVYVSPNLSVTADITGIAVPSGLADRISPGARAHYADVDIFGTWNLTERFGAQVGYRSIDVGLTYESNSGIVEFKGMYFGAVARY
jgi:hypothetical protein